MDPKSTLRLMRILELSLTSLAQSSWSLLSNALTEHDCIIGQTLIVLFSLKQIIGQTLANHLSILLRSSTCIIISKIEKNICTL